MPNFYFHIVGPDVRADIIDRLPMSKAKDNDSITGNCIKAVKQTITNTLLCINNHTF